MLPYYHPSSIAIVDDDVLFLETLKFSFSDAFPCETFPDPRRAVEVLRQRQLAVRGIEHFVVPNESTPDVATYEPGDQLVHVRTSGIAALVEDPSRFSQVSVIIVDYDMPALNGVQLCRQLVDMPVRKILLTGKATIDVAMRAFNERIIDSYIPKQDGDLATRLKTEIKALEAAYFTRIGQPLGSLLGLDATRFIADPGFDEFFATECRARHIVEHYVMAEPHGVLMASASGDVFVMAVQSEQSLAAHTEIAIAENASNDLVRGLAARAIVPIFPTPSGMYEKSLESTWRDHVWPARTLIGRETWFHALVTGPATSSLVPPGMVSYAGHRAGTSMTRH